MDQCSIIYCCIFLPKGGKESQGLYLTRMWSPVVTLRSRTGSPAAAGTNKNITYNYR